ncbi:transmembrane protein, putative (macronuclear) [Tetrahymena thermophila SB210]|uniref:Transmembrane protein, putative n=1 Tax=Tetrahymena thermophila (strain SB210) TaxID=312017 RepID=Q23PS6_TETTS|nr:transmembrane protein, putative [Tetrahymena thermophila SB210]EAR98609.2 transmembrane protein, putative [Tetrahymena thermophila SB210]|eukprot:XP_001018854.2 transmembrane protein, putative [Tetrahymena thermophila SB210]
MQNGACYEYCTDGKISKRYSDCGLDNVSCIDGYQLNSQNKCEKIICSAKISTADTFSAFQQQCLNCSIAFNQKDCSNPCLPGTELQYYNSQLRSCMVYCGNGIIAYDKNTCSSSNICINGAQWSDQEKQCKNQQIKCSSSSPDNYLQQCSNCSLVTNINYCQNSCQSQQYYDYKQQKCMIYCLKGVIAQDQVSCQSSNLCIDGFKSSGQGKCDPISSQDGQVNSNDNQSNSKYEQNLLIINIMISLFAFLIIIILAACFIALRKFKAFLKNSDKNNQKIYEIINNLESTQKIHIDNIKNQQLEIDSLKIIRNTNNQLHNNQIEIDFNQNSQEDLALQDQNDSQKTIKQLQSNFILQQQNSKQNYQENPLIQVQVSQQKDTDQL